MSMVTELIAAVSNAERQIDEQVARLRSFQKEIASVQRRTEAALSGSTQPYEQRMLEQLSQTDRQITDTIGRLQDAREKLTRVRMI